MFTLWRRFYLNIVRTNSFLADTSFTLLIALNSGLLYLFPISFIKEYIKEETGNSENLSNSVKYLKEIFTENSVAVFTYQVIFLHCKMFILYIVVYLVNDFFKDKILYREDIYTGKYSITTCFITYIINDCLSSILFFAICPLMVCFLPIRSLISYSFLLWMVAFALCYAIASLFLRHMCGGSTNVARCVFLFINFLAFTGISSSTIFFDLLADKYKRWFGWIKYGTYLYLLFPHIILWHLCKYVVYDHIVIMKKNKEKYIMDLDEKNMLLPDVKDVFDFLRCDNLYPFWIYHVVLWMSLVFNIIFAFYLFKRQIKAYIRLKLN